MNIYNWAILLCWLAFVGVWIVTGFQAKRTLSRNWIGLGWRFTLLITLVLIFGSQKTFRYFQPFQYQQSLSPIWSLVGIVCTIVGIGLAIWARVYLGRNWGMPMSIKENPELVVSGPYALIRHPIYTGMLLAMAGSAIVAGWWWLLVAVVSASFFIYSATQEEKLMQKTFPTTYPAYKARTKMLVPWVF